MEQFMELYESVYKDLYRLAYYYLGNSQDAEDMVSETVLKAYEKFDSLRKKEAFKNWIFKILVNQCRDFLRKKASRRTVELVNEKAFEMEMMDNVIAEDILSILSEEERQIVALVVFGGYKQEEISKLLHTKYSTVRTKYRRALKKLKQYMQSE